MECMATKRTHDRHKPGRLVRIPSVWCEVLEEIGEIEQNNLTDQVKAAVKEYLERRDKLPKPGTKPATRR
jgi:hypothetical protein